MEKRPMLTVATYNVLHGYYAGLILKNIEFLIGKGADVLCLQETDLPFEKPLHGLLKTPALEGWRAHCVHAGEGAALSMLWNSLRLDLRDLETIVLPRLRGRSLSQRIRGHEAVLQRAAVTGRFMTEEGLVRVTNVHLAWEGGVRHRMAQLAHLARALEAHPAERDVLGGDFNTIAPSLLRKSRQKKVEAVLGPSWTNALPDLSWSYDISYTAPQDGQATFAKLCRPLGIKARSRLDYLFARNLGVAHAEMFDLPGSDHRPLVGRFSVL